MSDNQARLIAMVDKMPAFPQAVSRIMELTSRAQCAPRDLVKVIEHDPVMTAKILKLVNSSYFGLSRPITSINHGVVFIGINTIKNLALSIAAMGVLPKKNDAGLDINQFLLHSLDVGTLSRLLAHRLGVPEKESTDYFVAGLLHDFGKVVLAQFMAAEFRQALERAADGSVALHEAERAIFNTDHAAIGGLLAAAWKLPPVLVGCIRHHHDLGQSGDWAPMRDCVFAANQVIRHLDFGQSGNRVIEPFPPTVRTRLGHDLPGLVEALGDLRPELDKTRVFMQA